MFILLNFLLRSGEVKFPIRLPIILKVNIRFNVPTFIFINFIFINLLTSNKIELNEKVKNEHWNMDKKFGNSKFGVSHRTGDKKMKKGFIISIAFHFMIIIGLFLLAPASDKIEGYPIVYRVGLVSFPSGGRISMGPSGSSGEKSVKLSGEKGVAIKELGKATTKNKKKKEEVAKASLQKDQTKITKKDEVAAEYGLGDGISSAQLDAYIFGSPYYLSIVFGKIRDEWENPVQSSSNLMTTIYFRILRDGNIVETKVEKTSGSDLFDQSAMRAIISGAPFPPLPNEFSGEYLGIHLEFEYVK